MKQEAGTNKKKWLLPVIIGAVVLLIAVAVGLFFLLGGNAGGPQAASTLSSPVYWNVDRNDYLDPATGLSNREAGEDGLYHIMFAVDGKQVELTCSDKKLVNRIDMMDHMGLELDSSNNIVGIIATTDLFTVPADGFYVQKLVGDVVTTNSSGALNGMPMDFTITDVTGIYNVSETAEVKGEPTELTIMDKVVVMQDADANTVYIFVTERPIDAEVYWRVDKYYGYNDVYDSKLKTTKRVPDENGVYTLLMASNGQQVEIKCKDLEIVNKIDSAAVNAQGIGLAFDEEGYAVQWTQPAKAVRGVEKANQYDVTEINGDTITFTRKLPGNEGDTYTCKLAPTCHIYDTTECADFVGQEVEELRLNDRVYLLCNTENEAVQIWITNRMVDSKMYWLHTRNFDTKTMQCTVKPDAAGYYHFQVCVEGKVLDVKTNDFDLLNQIQRPTTKAMGLEIEGNIVTRYYHYTRVSGGWAYGYGYVTSVNGPILSTESSSGTSYNMVLSADHQVYNCDFSADLVGEKSTLGVGDLVQNIRNAEGEIIISYITTKKADAPVYWSVTRKYSSTKKETTRTPDKDGYYVFEMARPGQGVVKLKTKSKDIATRIDKTYPQYVGLYTSGDIITKVFSAAGCVGGSSVAQYCHAEYWETEGSQFYALYRATGNGTSVKIDDNTKYYNVTATYSKYCGEPTSLRLGDRITVLTNRKGIAEMVFVVEREVNGSAYWRYKTYAKDEEGYYKWDFLNDGKMVTLKTKDEAVRSSVNSLNVGMGLFLNGDEITRAFGLASLSNYGSAEGANYDVTAINGNQVTLTRLRPGSSNTGDVITLTIGSWVKCYNVSNYGTPGELVKLKVGDRVVPYMDNSNKNVAIVFVTNPFTREQGFTSYCEHCGKEVQWLTYSANSTPSGSGHYYLAHDITATGVIQWGASGRLGEEAWDIVLDLNGKTLTSTKSRGINVMYDLKLSIMDTSEAQTGTVQSFGNSGSGNVVLVNYGGDLTIYGGTFKMLEDSTAPETLGGVIYCGNSQPTIGGQKVTLSDTLLDIKGGTFIGGPATNGGAIYATATEVKIANATVKAGNASSNANTIYLSSKKDVTITDSVIEGGVYVASGQSGKVTISGNTQIVKPEGGDFGINITSGKTVDFTGLTEGAKITVTGAGKFTTAYADEAAAKAALEIFSGDANGQVFGIEDNQLTTGIYRCLYGHTEADHAAEGNTCTAQITTWTLWTSKNSVPTAAGNYIIANDIKAYDRAVIKGADIVIDLNGKTITNGVNSSTTANYSLYLIDDKDFQGGKTKLEGGSLSIIDTSEAQTGKINFQMDDYVATAADKAAWAKDETVIANIEEAIALIAAEQAAAALEKDEEALLALDAAAKDIVAAKGIAPTDETYAAAYEAALEQVVMAKLLEMVEASYETVYAENYDALFAKEVARKTAEIEAPRRLNGDMGMLIYVRNGELNIYGGIIDGSNCNTTSASKGMINIGATHADDPDMNKVNIYGGTIIAGTSLKADGTAAANAGGINGVGAKTEINVYGGTLRGTEAEVNGEDTAIKANMGGLIYTPGTLNIYGGEFIGRNTNLGTTVYAATLNIEGGKFTNGKSAAADPIYVSSAVKATITGGEIESINVNGNGVTISGDAVIGNLKISEGKTVAIPTLGEKASIAVTAKEYFTTAYETKEAAAAVAAKLTVNGETPISVVNNRLSVGIPEGEVPEPEEPEVPEEPEQVGTCYLGHDAAAHKSNDCQLPLVEWTEWTNATKLPTTSGNYKLMSDITATGQAFITNGQQIAIDLNGKTVTSPNRVVMIHGGSNVVLTDTSSADPAKQGTMKTLLTGLNASYAGGNVLYANNGTLTVYGGNYDATSMTTAPTTEQNTAAFGGTVLHVLPNCPTELLGGTFTGGTAWRGATIMNRGQLIIAGNAVVTGGRATNVGGVFYNEKTVSIGGNAVINCTPGYTGYAATMVGGTINIYDNATINRNEKSAVVLMLNSLTSDVTIRGNATINGQITIPDTGSAYKKVLTIAGTPTFVIEAPTASIFFQQTKADISNVIDASGLTGGTGFTVRLPDAARTGMFGIGAEGVDTLITSNDNNYKVVVNNGKLEMIAAPVEEAPEQPAPTEPQA